MKTLSKLSINPEKVLENFELKQLKGGWEGYCWVYNAISQVVMQGGGGGSSQQQAEDHCNQIYNQYQYYCRCNES